MKKLAALLAVVCLLALAQVGYAADLQAGWYAKIWGVNVYTYDYMGVPQLATGSYFYGTPPGQYGPFLVADDPLHFYDQCIVSVPMSVSSVDASQSPVLPLYIPLSAGTTIAYFSMAVATNYDASQMYLDLWHTKDGGGNEILWTQRLSGQHGWSGHLAVDTVLAGEYHFRLSIVPEPSTIAPLLLGLGALTPALRRRG